MVSTESANPQNPPNRETQTPRYLAIQFKVNFRLGARRRRGFSPAAAARHQDRSQRMRTKNWAPNSGSLSIYPNPGVYLGYMEVYLYKESGSLSPEFGPRIVGSPSSGPTLMACGSFGAMRLAAARPFELVPRKLSFSIWWISGVYQFQ